MKKMLTGLTAGVLLVAFSAVGFANPQEGRHHREFSQEHKAIFAEFMQEKQKLDIEFLTSEVAAGRMSKKEADARIILMEEHAKRFKEGRKPMTEEQRAAFAAHHEKVKNLKIQSIQKAINEGKISQAEGQRMLERVQTEKGSRHNGSWH